jgi:hypothetical protein
MLPRPELEKLQEFLLLKQKVFLVVDRRACDFRKRLDFQGQRLCELLI